MKIGQVFFFLIFIIVVVEIYFTEIASQFVIKIIHIPSNFEYQLI